MVHVLNITSGNLYCYGANNPVRYIDPDGRCPFLVITGIAGALIGAAVESVNSYEETGKVDGWRVLKGAAIGGAIGLGAGAAVSLGATALAGTGITALASEAEIAACGTIIGQKVIAGLTATILTISQQSGDKVSKFSADGLKMTQTVANHLNDIVKKGVNKGQPSRPYLTSNLLINEIMNAQNPAKDAYVDGALKWNVEGTFNGAKGTWELVVDFTNNIILHFNFVTPE